MKNILFLIPLIFLLTNCTPKTGEVVTEKPMVTQPEPKETFRNQAPDAGPAPKIQMGTYDLVTLENGLKVIMVENDKLPTISTQLFIDAPVIKEGDAAGYVSMAGDMLSKGTKTKTKSEIDEAVDFIGASFSTSSRGMNAYSLSKHSDKVFDIMADVLYNASFPEQEFEKLKKQTLSGLASSKDDPNAIASNVGDVLTYGKDHPYGEIMTEETVEKISLDQIKSYYNTYFKPNISYLVVVGDFDKAKMKKKVEETFGAWKSSDDIKKMTFEKPEIPTSTTVDFVNKNGAVQSVIKLTYPLEMKPGTPDVIPARVMNTMLGGYFQSRINQNLRETHGYTYGARSRIDSDKLIGYFTAGGSVRNEVTDSSITELIYELDRIRTGEIPTDELEMVKSVMAGQFARSLENPSTVARFALNTFRYDLPKDYYANYLQRLSQVTAADVKMMANKYVHPDKAHIVVVGSKDDVADKLGKFAADGEVRYYDYYGDRIEMDESPVNMTVGQVFEKYINAIGGKDKVTKVKDLTQNHETEVQGMKIEATMINKAPNKMTVSFAMNGNVMEEQKFDGSKGSVSQMGAVTPMDEGALDEMIISSPIFVELNENMSNAKAIVKGMEKVDGKSAICVQIESAGGTKMSNYYDKETGLKLKTEITGQSGTQTVIYKDYQEVDGVKIPHTLKISGSSLPIPLTLEAKSVKINTGVEDSQFN